MRKEGSESKIFGEPLAFLAQDRAGRFPFLAAMDERVLVWDGAMGTMLQEAGLTLEDFSGLEGCNEILVRTRPEVVADIHRAYFDAGADVVETNTFGATSLVLSEYGLEKDALELNRKAAQIAREVADSCSTGTWLRFVAGSMGPTTRLVTLGHVDFDDLYSIYLEQARGLIEGGVDLLQIETCQDLLQIKCAVSASREAMDVLGIEVPIFVTVTMETTGTMLVGSDIGAALATLEALPVDGIGLNCATGPDLMQEHVRFLGEHCTRKVLILPNAGLPQNIGGQTVYDLTPKELAKFHRRFVEEFGVSAVGGCCGTTQEHIRAVAETVEGLVPRPRPSHFPPQVASLYGAVSLDQESGPLIVGERTNANGSKKFRETMLDEDWDGLVEIAKGQSREGAHILDVCTAFVGRDEARDMSEVVLRFVTQVPIPLMVDSTQIDVLEAALKLIPGRPVINSINLEDGEPRADEICRLARKYGAALVALTIDEDGMAKTWEKKLEVAKRIHEIVTKRHGLPSDCLLFDPLTFTIASGDEDSRDAGVQTLKGLEAIKRELPGVRTLLGLSNISFGLKPYPRRILNSVYLHEAIQHGLDSAIMNSGKIIPIHRLSKEDLEVTLDLIYDRRSKGYDPLFAFIDRFGARTAKAEATKEDENDLPVEERLKRRIIDGNRTGIEAHLEEAMLAHKPLEIINQILLEGMKTVGELFGSGQMQLPFVLQSAETMKYCVTFLEPHLDKLEGSEKGIMVLATVRGDVHDIGKNLVDIILSNNGYKVVNLGIKQPLENILKAAEEYKAHAIGMSGLLVKSTVVMKENLELMNRKDWGTPVICGGAALSRSYVENDLRVAYGNDVFYGKDAFTGLHLMDEICGISKVKTLTVQTPHQVVRHETRLERETRLEHSFLEYAEPSVRRVTDIPLPPFFGGRVVGSDELDLGTILRFVNKRVLYKFQWQYKKGKLSEEEYEKLMKVAEEKFTYWGQRAQAESLLEPQVAYGFFPCNAERNELVVYDPEGEGELARFLLPRQPKGKRLCVADYFLPVESGKRDVVAFSIVTMGQVATQTCQNLFGENKYDDYLHFYGMSVEATEALAEYWHKRVRQQLGIADHDSPNIKDLFKQAYRGSRFSFGYPACPNLQDQEKVLSILPADSIGVSLTEEWQLDPEQSTSALVCHHPEARYFNLMAVR
jgi:5-methyltetrahydrofolate--homocysteine methyltransferase